MSLERAKGLGCSTIQIFSHNPRQWRVRNIPGGDALQFRILRRLYDIDPVFIHTSYLINLAAANRDVLKKSLGLLVKEMELADAIGADYVVLHTGSSRAEGAEGRKIATEALREILDPGKWKARLLLENTAGERGDISSGIKDLAEIIDEAGGKVIEGICFDTCHGFQAGYDISKKSGLDKLSTEIRKYLGVGMVKLIHLNDSKKSFNSGVDRHEHIGQGRIGKEGLRRFLGHPLFRNVPLILETPKKTEHDDPRNLKTVREILIQ